MSLVLNGTTGITNLPSINSGQIGGSRNKIINGAMMIDQRNAGASVATTSASATIYTLDRWNYSVSQASKFTVQQNAASVTPPAGFINYLGVTSTSAYSVLAADAFSIRQQIEGFNFADMAWGTASASAVTLSFRVYSSLTGTFGGSVFNSAVNRCYPFSYSIPVANTWTTISVTIAGDTSGTWLTTNGIGMFLNFSLGTGTTGSGTAGSWGSTFYNSATSAVSVVGTSGATFYITGVQLEKGSTATDFESRSFGEELALCQRYYEKSYDYDVAVGAATYVGIHVAGGDVARTAGTSYISGNNIVFTVRKRDNPTIVGYDQAGNSGKAQRFQLGSHNTNDQNATIQNVATRGFFFYSSGTSNSTGVQMHFTADAEL